MYTDIENITTEDDTIINWRKRRGHTQLKCPKCDDWFSLPKDIEIDANGYCSAQVYHFCKEYGDEPEENNNGWTVLAHLVGWE